MPNGALVFRADESDWLLRNFGVEFGSSSGLGRRDHHVSPSSTPELIERGAVFGMTESKSYYPH